MQPSPLAILARMKARATDPTIVRKVGGDTEVNSGRTKQLGDITRGPKTPLEAQREKNPSILIPKKMPASNVRSAANKPRLV